MRTKTIKQIVDRMFRLRMTIGDAQEELNKLEHELPKGYLSFYKSNNDRLEKIYFRGTQSTLKNWLKELEEMLEKPIKKHKN